jgi:DNA-binding NarL/FixJ family response regulator
MKLLAGKSPLIITSPPSPPAEPIKVAIVEGDQIIRTSLRQLLERAPEIRCVQVYGDTTAALYSLPVIAPDVALVDLKPPGLTGAEFVARLKKRAPLIGILVLATFEDSNLIFDTLRAGADGCLMKTVPQSELVQAMLMVHGGGSPVSVQMARKMAAHFQPAGNYGPQKTKLTGPEQAVLALLAKGHSYPAIGNQLGLSPDAVSVQLRGVCEKLKS